jgi:methenyltetrahydromethanopterin cyclohydrolase
MSQQGREILFLEDVQEGAEAHRALHWIGTRVSSHGQAAMTEIKNEWSYTSTPIVCLLGVDMANWSFLVDDWFKAMILL